MNPTPPIPPSIATACGAASVNLTEEVGAVISACAERIHYAESRRIAFQVVGGAIFAAGAALLPVALTQASSYTLLAPLAVATVSFFVLGLAMLFVFSKQTNRYPFTSATSTWKWFYRDALPNHKEFDFGWLGYFERGWKKIEADKKAAFQTQLPIFADQIATLTAPDVNSWQDVQQLYVLHVTEKYKNFHLSHLRDLLNIGLVMTVILTLVSIPIGYWLDAKFGEIVGTHRIETGVVIDVRWRALNSVTQMADKRRWLINISIDNQSSTPITSIDLVARDKVGLLVPMQIVSSKVPQGGVPINTEETFQFISETVVDFGPSDIRFEATKK